MTETPNRIETSFNKHPQKGYRRSVAPMTPAEIDDAGTGGGLRYLSEHSTPGMVCQELSHSCQVACARQLLRDAGLEVSEKELLDQIGYLESYGTISAATAEILTNLHPRLAFAGGAVDPDSVEILFRGPAWIASLRTDRGTIHTVIVDKIEGGVVHVRDPWGTSGPGSGIGTQATINLADFLDHWHWAINNAVIPVRSK